MYVYIYLQSYQYTYEWDKYIAVHMNEKIYIHIYGYTLIYVHRYICVYIHKDVYIYVQIYRYTNEWDKYTTVRVANIRDVYIWEYSRRVRVANTIYIFVFANTIYIFVRVANTIYIFVRVAYTNVYICIRVRVANIPIYKYIYIVFATRTNIYIVYIIYIFVDKYTTVRVANKTHVTFSEPARSMRFKTPRRVSVLSFDMYIYIRGVLICIYIYIYTYKETPRRVLRDATRSFQDRWDSKLRVASPCSRRP